MNLNVLSENQSAYCEFHSTEMVCGIVNAMLECIDDGKCAVLVLGLIAAFDSVDRKLLI